MKARALLLLAAAVGAFLSTVPARAAVTETATEFQATGDFDGDGRDDFAVVEKATGIYRIGYQAVAGTWTWSEARAGGVENVSGITVGRVLSTARDALVLTSPEVNRVNVLEAASAVALSPPVSWFPPAVGPRTVVVADIGGGGNTAHDDLVGFAALNDPPSVHRRVLARATAAGIASLGAAVNSVEYLRGDRVRLEAGGPLLVGLVAAGGGGAFEAYNWASGAPVLVASAAGLPADARFVQARFGAGTLHQYLFFQPGTSNLQLRAVQSPLPGTLTFGAAVNFPLGRRVDAVTALPGPSSVRLLVLSGGTAVVYAFDGVAAPVLVTSFSAPAGEAFSGAVPTGDLGVMLLTGPPGSGRSEGWLLQRWNGSQYVNAGSGRLPDGSPYAASANVFVFRSEPFVNPSPVLVQRLAAGDWTSQPALVGAPLKINVTVESFGGAAAGLGSPAVRSMGDVTPPGAFALANQYLPSISLFSFVPPVGDEVVEVQVSPAPGPQSVAVEITLTASVAGASVFYRLDGAAGWTSYSAPFPIFRDTTVRYYAQAPGSDRKSVVHSATYTFPRPPAEMDSDNDGVPDYAELGLDANNNGIPDYAELGAGLSPVTGSKDADGDGYGDLDEWVAGSNPYSAASVPAAGTRLEDRSGYDLFVTPRPLDGPTGLLSTVASGNNLRLHVPGGELLRFARATNLPAPAPAGVPTAKLTNVPIDTGQRFLVLSTEPHYPIQTAGTDKQLGRELLGLQIVPVLDAGIPVSRALGAGTLKAEAAAWRAAAQAAAAGQPRLRMVRELTPTDTLVALLVEAQIESTMAARGVIGTNPISLFPFRVPDVDRYVPKLDELLALEHEAPGGPPFRLLEVCSAISNAVIADPSPGILDLRRLTDDVYRISSASNNAAPGVLRLPVDVLRDFMRSGVLDPAYRTRSAFTDLDLESAANGVAESLNAPSPRPLVTMNLAVVSGGVTRNCTTLYSGADPVSLYFGDGSAFLFPESFEVVAGSVVQVSGYVDLPSGLGGCPGSAVEVVQAGVASVPSVPVVDTDGDLLPDSYERAFFGSLAAGPYDDADLDGFSNLQEFIDGTDPKDKLAKGVVPVVLLPPAVQLIVKAGGTLGMKWKFPASYAGKFKFGVKTAPSLSELFHDIPVTVSSLGGDEFEVQLPLPAGGTQFYYLYFQLK